MTPELTRIVCDRIHSERLLSIEAALNDDFRASLQKDPRGAVEYLLNRHLPDDVEIEVATMDPRRIRITLPPKPALDAELSDADLESVAGGTGSYTEQQALDLQTLMQKQSEIMQTISNIMKAQSDAQKSIISNLK